ncbi:NAD(+)/NADH kinase [Thalassoglobus sp. JC818]|uniref:NAD(+)/NADH kinase n=1 Tax=Thalassoglobus sp. JC818 TaxID=3232136 RepID=UPI0034583763
MRRKRGMSEPALKIVIVARDQSSHVQKAQRRLSKILAEKDGIELVATLTTSDETIGDQDVDVALVVGGDGAILRACRWFENEQIPILGVNLGRLGFLAEIAEDDVEVILDDLVERRYSVVSHLMFECIHRQADGKESCYHGLNEAAILAGASLSLIDIELSINGTEVTTFSGDGLIVSTPVGSTAHNLSAGGPILRQDLRAFVVTPICPHTLTVRPIVDRADAEYRLTADFVPDGVMLVVDGQIRVPFSSGDEVIVREAEISFQLLRVEGYDFYGTLHRKLGWDGQPRYRRSRIPRQEH